MLINIKMMTEEAYKTLQKNYKEVYENIINHPSDSTWLEPFLGFEPYEEKKYLIEDFVLDYSENYDDVRFKNAVTIYEHLKELPRYILCNNRFWAWITFDLAYKQSIASLELKSESIVKNWWLIGQSRRDLMLGVSSRNFFEIEVSVDSTAENKYELSEYLFNSIDEMYRALTFRNIGMLKHISLPYIRVQKDYEQTYDYKMVKPISRSLIKEASKLGSVMLIDALEEKEVYDFLYPKLVKIIDKKSLSEEWM